jgi:hypothetical protein
MTDTPDILILVSTTEMEALKADLARAEGVIDLLESHARVQAKLLADTGRERDELRRPAPRLSAEQLAAWFFHDCNVAVYACGELAEEMLRYFDVRPLEGVAVHLPSVTSPNITEALRLLRKISDLAYDEDVGEPLDCAIDYANKAIAALTSTQPPDIEAISRNYAQRWLGQDWYSMDEKVKAYLRIEAHRWIKCWPAASSAERRCQKCGCATGGEEAWVDGQIWCHPCADAASPTQQGPLVPWELKCSHQPCTAPECNCRAVSSSDTLCGQIAAIYGEMDAEDCAMIDREWARMRGYILPTIGTSTLSSTECGDAT